MDLDRAIHDQGTRADFMVGGQHPGVLAPATQLRSREMALGGRNAGQGTGKHLVIATGAAQGENNVILATVIEPPLAVEAHRRRPGVARLSHVVMRLIAEETLQLGDIRLGAVRMAGERFPIERTNVIILETPDHMIALVEVSQPPRAQGWQDLVFPEIKADDPCGKLQEGSVVGQLAAHRIGHRHRPLAHALRETRHAEQRIAAEGHRIKPSVGHPRVEHIDALQAGNTLQIQPVVEDQQIAPLDKRNAHAAGEETMLRMSATARPGCEQGHHRFVHAARRERAKRLENGDRNIGDTLRIVVLECFGKNARKRPAVLHHIADTRGIAEIMVCHGQPSVRAPRQGQAGQMEERAAGPGQTDRRTLEKRAAQDDTGRNDLRAENAFLTMDIVQKEFEGFEPLPHASRHLHPLAPAEQGRQDVAEPRTPPPRPVAGDVEGHSHLAHRRFEPFDD